MSESEPIDQNELDYEEELDEAKETNVDIKPDIVSWHAFCWFAINC